MPKLPSAASRAREDKRKSPVWLSAKDCRGIVIALRLQRDARIANNEDVRYLDKLINQLHDDNI